MGSIVFQSHGFTVLFHDVHEDFRIQSPRLPQLVAGEEIDLLAHGEREVVAEDPFGDRARVQRDVDAYVLAHLGVLARTEAEHAKKLAGIKADPPEFEIEGHTIRVGQRVLVLHRDSPADRWRVEPKSVGFSEEDECTDTVDTPFVLVNARQHEGKWGVTFALERDWTQGTGTAQVPDGNGTWQRKVLPWPASDRENPGV